MPKFQPKAYKEKLQTATSCETCEKVPLPKLDKDSRYIFISYSHKDYQKVYCDLADLYASDIPFWYDRGLPAGKNWDDVVREKMTDPRCAGIIFFLSENLFLSQSIQTEIHIACGDDGDPNAPKMRRNFFCVNLTDKCPSKILTDVFSAKQFSGVEDEMTARGDWVETLRNAFPDKATYLSFDEPHHKANLVEQIGINFGINPNYNPFAFGGAFFRAGNGVIEFENGAVYDGAFLDGAFHGNGTLTLSNGSAYKGEWMSGKRHGQGTMTMPDGCSYTGEWRENHMHGQGTVTFADGAAYAGEWVDGRMEGQGTYTSSNGSVYTGEWMDNQMNGQGTMTYADGNVYTGEWVNGDMQGQGTMTYTDGSIYIGQWVKSEWCGEGSFTRGCDGHKFVGGWGENGSKGYGTYIYPDGASRAGNWDGETLLEGEGVLRYDDGSFYDGQIKNNLRHGKGVYTLADGTVQAGYFENDVFIGTNT